MEGETMAFAITSEMEVEYTEKPPFAGNRVISIQHIKVPYKGTATTAKGVADEYVTDPDLVALYKFNPSILAGITTAPGVTIDTTQLEILHADKAKAFMG